MPADTPSEISSKRIIRFFFIAFSFASS